MSPVRRRPGRSDVVVDAPDARTLAAEWPGEERVDWRALEVAALRPHPRVLGVLDPAGRYNGGRRWPLRAGRTSVAVWLVLPLGLLLLGAPVWGSTTFYSEGFRSTARTTDWSTRYPVAGVLFALAVVVLLGLAAQWAASGRARNGVLVALSWVTLVLAALSIPAALRGSRQDGIPGGSLWLGVVVGAVVVAAVVLVVLQVATVREPAVEAAPVPLAAVRREFAALGPEAQRAVRADLGDAVRLLAQRGLVDPAEAEVAQQAEPGLVAMLMSQRPR